MAGSLTLGFPGFHLSCQLPLKASIGIDVYGEVVPAERFVQRANIRRAVVWVQQTRVRLAVNQISTSG